MKFYDVVPPKLYWAFGKMVNAIDSLRFKIRFRFLRLKYGDVSNIPQSEIGKLLGPISEGAANHMKVIASLSELSDRLKIDIFDTQFGIRVGRLMQGVYQTRDDLKFSDQWEDLIFKKPIRRTLLTELLRYRDITTTDIEKLFPGELRAKFEDWLDEA